MQKGAIILCGGKSSRMGRDKATLPFGNELMLERVVRLVSSVVAPSNIAVVAAANQLLPPLPAEVVVVRDEKQYRGPLQGLAGGLTAIGNRIDAVYATGCDAPLLLPAFIEHMFELLGDCDAVIPVDDSHLHPLSAAFRPTVLPHIHALLATDQLRLSRLFDLIHTRPIAVDELRKVDPQLASLQRMNHYDEYLKALSAAGLVAPPQTGEPHGPTL